MLKNIIYLIAATVIFFSCQSNTQVQGKKDNNDSKTKQEETNQGFTTAKQTDELLTGTGNKKDIKTLFDRGHIRKSENIL